MKPSKPLCAELQSPGSKRLVRGLAAHTPYASSLASSTGSAVPNPHFRSFDTLRTGRDRRASAVAREGSPRRQGGPPREGARRQGKDGLEPWKRRRLARIAGDDEFSTDAVDAHSIGQKTDSAYNAISDSCASATGFHNSSSLAGTQRAQQPLVRSLVGPQAQQTHASLVVGAVARVFSTGDEVDGVAATAEVVTTGGIAQQPPVTARDKDNDNTQSRTLLLAFTC